MTEPIKLALIGAGSSYAPDLDSSSPAGVVVDLGQGIQLRRLGLGRLRL
jgi:hypothetical protein